MKKLSLVLGLILAIGLIAFNSWAKEYRVKVDLIFMDEADAVALMNHIESIKDKVYIPLPGDPDFIRLEADFIDSFDLLPTPKGGSTRTKVDFGNPVAKVHVKQDVSKAARQSAKNLKQNDLNSKVSDNATEQTALDAEQAAIDALP